MWRKSGKGGRPTESDKWEKHESIRKQGGEKSRSHRRWGEQLGGKGIPAASRATKSRETKGLDQ